MRIIYLSILHLVAIVEPEPARHGEQHTVQGGLLLPGSEVAGAAGAAYWIWI